MSGITEAPAGAANDAIAPPLPLTSEALAGIQGLYERGLCLQAYKASLPYGPLKSWKTIAGRILAGRLAGNIGDYQLGRVHHYLAWRSNKTEPDLIAYHAYTLLQRRGPLATLEFLDRFGKEEPGPSADGLTHYFSIRAYVGTALRDFATAHSWLERAAAVDPKDPWVEVTRSHVLETQDRYADALAAAQRSLELRPWYRPGVQAVAHTYQLLHRDEEALALLTEADRHLENLHVTRQLAALQEEFKLYEEAAASYERVATLGPLFDETERLWLQQRKVTLACLRNRFPAALETARELDEPYYRELAERIAKDAPRRRVLLEVPFVRQHHQTCAPATLSALSRFWNQPTEHLEIAEEICYDGTPAHSERHWADTHGWATREFTVTWESAVALLNRGIPFTLTTSGATSGHLQAVVGYDELRQTMWIRDPFVYLRTEVIAKSFLELFSSTGPRGMAMVPAAQAQLYDGLDLPDAQLYDQLHSVERALAAHRRPEALATCEQMQKAAPNHRLTLTVRRSIAAYDRNTPALLACLNQLLEQFPKDSNLLLNKLACLQELARRDERLQLLEELATSPQPDPIFWQHYAQELSADARNQRIAAGWLRWTLRYRAAEPAVLHAWACLLWDQRDFAAATRLYRIAAGLGDKSEQFARSYFIASRHLRQTETALAFLKTRDAELGPKSSGPTLTLVESLLHLRRSDEAFKCLEAAVARRPTDSVLLLFAADIHVRFGRFAEADKLLKQAREHSPLVAWHRAAATVAGYQNRKTEALEHWRKLLQFDPLAHEAIEAAALLLAETQSRKAALTFLDDLCKQFPCSCPLLRLRVQWLQDEGAEAAIAPLRQLLEANPADAWAWRELAIKYSDTRRYPEAMDALQEAIRVEPHQSAGYSVRGHVLLRQGNLAEARNDFLQALRLEIDNETAIEHYVSLAPSLAERKNALAMVAEELRRQVIFNNALFAYQTAARGLLPPEEVLQLLRDAHAARSDLWQAWSVLINQLIDLGQHDEALALARNATERFPLLPRLWLDLARAEQARLNNSGEVEALEKALEISPGYAAASRQLATLYDRTHDLAKARELLDEALAYNPLDVVNHGCLAHILYLNGQLQPAIAQLQQAIRLDPGYNWAWSSLRQWQQELPEPKDMAVELAYELTGTRAGEARSWLILANSLDPEKNSAELFAALDQALTLNPRSEEAYDIRGRVLAQLDRFDEALAQCGPPVFLNTPPRLRLRAAWIEAQRGNLASALEKAKNALAEHPDYYQGWQLLADWQVQTGQIKDAVRAAEAMASLAPLESVPLGYLGDLKLRLEDRAGAAAAFQRAFTLDPHYDYAGFNLLDMQLEDRDFAAAEATLKILQRAGETPQTLAMTVLLACKLNEWPRALDAFKRLCADSRTAHHPLERAMRALDTACGLKQVDAVFDHALAQPNCNPVVGELWIDRMIARNRWRIHKPMAGLQANQLLGRRVLLHYLDHLGDAFQKARSNKDVTTPWRLYYHFKKVLKAYGPWLSADTEGWGKVGYVLTCAGKPRPAIDWLGDWRNRPKAESWMLYNLALMLQRAKRFDEARDLICEAVTFRHSSDLYEYFRTHAAFEQALLGNADEARRHLAALPSGDHIRVDLRPLRAMTAILLGLDGSHSDEKDKRLANFKAAVKGAFDNGNPAKHERMIREAYRRFALAAAQKIPGVQFWTSWYYRGTDWMRIGLLILLLPTIFVVPPAGFVCLYFLIRERNRQ